MSSNDVKNDSQMTKRLVVITFIFMILTNAFANIFKLNDMTTGEVLQMYPNLFAPANYAFSIWMVIYLGLAGFVFYQLKNTFYSPETAAMVEKLRNWFSFSSVINAMWILAWHYNEIGFSVFFMIILLFALSRCIRLIHTAKLTTNERKWIQMPLSFYFGWVTVATMANITVWFVRIRFEGNDVLWTCLLLGVGVLISSFVIYRFKDVVYGLAVLWGYVAILYRHLNLFLPYQEIIIVSAISILCLIAMMVYVSYHRLRNRIRKMR